MESIEQGVIIIVKEILGALDEEIDLDDDLEPYGMNSITYIKIVANLENKWGVEINGDDLNKENFQTLNKIIEIIKAQIRQRD